MTCRRRLPKDLAGMMVRYVAKPAQRLSAHKRRWQSVSLVLISLAALAGPPGAWAQATQQVQNGLLLIDAIRGALKQNVNTLLQQQQVASNEGQVLQQRGLFDPIATATLTHSRIATTLPAYELDALQAAGVTDIFQEKTDATSNVYGISRMLANGMTIGANYGVTSTVDNINNLTYDIQNGGRETSGKLSFTLTVPLLKNAGRETVGAQLDAAEAQLRAAQFSLLYTNARTVLVTTVDYWAYLSAHKNLEIATTAENNAQILIEQIQKLIAAGELPKSDIDLAVASHADKSVNRIAAEQAEIDARRTLARQMGMPVVQMNELPLPANDYPEFEPGKVDLSGETGRLIKQALAKRADLEADRLQQLAAGYLTVAARNNLKPELDLNVGGSYAGLAEGAQVSSYERAYYTNRYGPSFNVSLSFDYPVGNSQAKGLLAMQLAQEQQAVITVQDLEATVASNVTTQVRGLQHSVQQLAEGIESVRRYTISLHNELIKRSLGTATLLDVVNMEDRLVAAQLNETQLRQAYAVAIAQLRFETGTLVRQNGDAFDVRVRDILYPDFPSNS